MPSFPIIGSAAKAPRLRSRLTSTLGATGLRRRKLHRTMQLLPIRLNPGDDLRSSLEALVPPGQSEGYFVLAGIGSLVNPSLRLAGAAAPTVFQGEFEIKSLSGTVTNSGAHLHAVISDSSGRVLGGHVVPGNIVRTTAELLLVLVQGWHLSRALDPSTGFAELVISKLGSTRGGA